MAIKEAAARIKINKLLEQAGWRFFPEGNSPANIRLESGVTITASDLSAFDGRIKIDVRQENETAQFICS